MSWQFIFLLGRKNLDRKINYHSLHVLSIKQLVIILFRLVFELTFLV